MTKKEKEKEKAKEKEKFLADIKIEIEDLEKEVKNSRLQNLKTKRIRSRKIFLRILKYCYPMIVSFIMVITTLKLLGAGYPFVVDEERKNLYVKKVIDNEGNIQYTKQYSAFSEEKDKVVCYSKWEFQDGEYRRNIDTYGIKSFSEEELIAIIDSGEFDLTKALGHPYRIVETKTDGISEEELKSDKEKIELYIYDKNDEKFIKVMENNYDNTIYTALIILVEIIAVAATWAIRGELYSKSDLNWDIDEMRKTYPMIDEGTLLTILEIKRRNYNVLTRGTNDEK